MTKGIIYVMSTVVDGLIKIGKTGCENFEQRMTLLENNGYRNITGLKREFAIELDNYDDKEILLDDIFEKSRVGNTELFSIDKNKVIQLLSSFEGKIVYPIQENKDEIFEQATEKIQNELLPNGEYTYTCNTKTLKGCKGVLVVLDGKIFLQKGAVIGELTKDAVNHQTRQWVRKRKTLNLVGNILQEQTECSSVSEASNLVSGHFTNGWECWKDKNGNIIDIYRNKNKEQ